MKLSQQAYWYQPTHLTKDAVDQIEILKSRFQLIDSDIELFLDLIRKGLHLLGLQNFIEEKINLVRSFGGFSEQLMQALISAGSSFVSNPISFLWGRLCAADIVRFTYGYAPGCLVDSQLDIGKLREYIKADLFENLFAPPSSLPVRYAGAIASVKVTLKDGLEAIGSGFCVWHNIINRVIFITCKHNVENATSVVIETSDNQHLDVKPLYLSPCHDVAVSIVSDPPQGPMLRLDSDLAVFDPVFTLGFPMIPGVNTMLVCHRGEFNGQGNLYLANVPILLISNLVSPGSSGGPVLTNDGRCIGMTINWLEATWGSQSAKFSAALPASLIETVLDEYVLSLSSAKALQ